MFVFRLVDTLVAKADVRVHYQRADRSIILNASTGQPYARVVPDILVERRADATIRIAIDAKYKLYDERRLSSGDVYQSFLYAYAYGNTCGQSLPTALVVYPSSGGASQAVRLRIRSAQSLAAAEILALCISIPSALAEGYGADSAAGHEGPGAGDPTGALRHETAGGLTGFLGVHGLPITGMIAPILGIRRAHRSSGRQSLADALFTKTQQRVLRVLFGQPDRSVYASDLIRDAGTGSVAAQRELARLEHSGLIVARRIGNQKHYQANAASPLFADLRNIVLKTVGLVEPLRQALKPIESEIRAAFVYGSVAKGSDQATSDIDLMVVSDTLSYGDVFGALDKVSRMLGRTVNPTVYSNAEFSKRTKTDNAFVNRVLEGPKVWVIGVGDSVLVNA